MFMYRLQCHDMEKELWDVLAETDKAETSAIRAQGRAERNVNTNLVNKARSTTRSSEHIEL